MTREIRFLTEEEKLRRDVDEFRGASANARFRALFELSELCERLLDASPCRERQLALIGERERAGLQRWKEWIRLHVGRGSISDAAR